MTVPIGNTIWVHGRIDFNPPKQVRTKKRGPRIPVPRSLLAALRRVQQRPTCDHVIAYQGAPVLDCKKGLTAQPRAGIPECTSHTMRHTAGTWMEQSGVSMHEIAGYLSCGRRALLSSRRGALRRYIVGMGPTPKAQVAPNLLKRMVLPVGIEPTTSPLPRGCSTTELRQRSGRAIHEAPAVGKACPSALINRQGFPDQTRLPLPRRREPSAYVGERLDSLPTLSLHDWMSELPRITPAKQEERAAREARLAKALRDNLLRRKEQKRAQKRQPVHQSQSADGKCEPPA